MTMSRRFQTPRFVPPNFSVSSNLHRLYRVLIALLSQVIGPDAHGIKTVIEIRKKEDGTKVTSKNKPFPQKNKFRRRRLRAKLFVVAEHFRSSFQVKVIRKFRVSKVVKKASSHAT